MMRARFGDLSSVDKVGLEKYNTWFTCAQEI